MYHLIIMYISYDSMFCSQTSGSMACGPPDEAEETITIAITIAITISIPIAITIAITITIIISLWAPR